MCTHQIWGTPCDQFMGISALTPLQGVLSARLETWRCAHGLTYPASAPERSSQPEVNRSCGTNVSELAFDQSPGPPAFDRGSIALIYIIHQFPNEYLLLYFTRYIWTHTVTRQALNN